MRKDQFVSSADWINNASIRELELEQRRLRIRIAWRRKVGDEITEDLLSAYDNINKELQYRAERG